MQKTGTTNNVSCSVPILTGTALPLGALRTAESCGVGEFADLIPFADFCKKAGLGIIQLLPINDTGTESSPYSALSAFALHPLYARLQDFPESACVKTKITELAAEHEKNTRFSYRILRDAKLALLREMYEFHAQSIGSSSELTEWILQNNWVISYAVFMELKRQHNEASWKEWKQARLSTEQINEIWNNIPQKKEHLFFAWLQMRLDEQFSKAAEYVKKKGLLLKGDIPILMNEDSCDIWAQPHYFSDALRAGAPADGQNPLGQNWGFPIYKWDNHKKDNYSWWKNRLHQAEKYYSAYRIDHVLGFFRIWAVPEADFSAMLGHPEPYEPITTDELKQAGFDASRIRWLLQPHIPTDAASAVNGGNYADTHRLLSLLMDRIGGEELWLFKPTVRGERDIYAAPLPDALKNLLCSFWRDRTLIEVTNGCFTPLWSFRQTTAWQSLTETEKQSLYALMEKKQLLMEQKWEAQAKEILGELTASVSMIPCAEDLGAGIPGMSNTLKQLGILSLRVLRWTRAWEENGCPFTPPENYPFLSVATISVHDSSTSRGWWLSGNEAYDFLKAFPAQSPQVAAGAFTPETAAHILNTAAKAASALCVHPIQDFLYLDRRYYEDQPEMEQINIPGTVNTFNWTYRMKVCPAELAKNTDLCRKIREIVKAHEKFAHIFIA